MEHKVRGGWVVHHLSIANVCKLSIVGQGHLGLGNWQGIRMVKRARPFRGS